MKLLILAMIGGMTLSSAALAADSGRTDATPGSAIDEWDDDMWSDWGAPASTTPGKNAPTEERKDDTTAGTPDFGAPSASTSFGNSDSVFRFRLVRDSEDSQPRGVRKHRPTYTRKRL